MADFFNPYLDFSNCALKLPGFSLNVLKYVDDKTHKLRYVFMNREKGEVYFVVIFSLLYGEELQEKADEDAREAGNLGGIESASREAKHGQSGSEQRQQEQTAQPPEPKQEMVPPPSAPSGNTGSTHEDAQGNVFHHSADDDGVD
jgi:hypothetical protein